MRYIISGGDARGQDATSRRREAGGRKAGRAEYCWTRNEVERVRSGCCSALTDPSVVTSKTCIRPMCKSDVHAIAEIPFRAFFLGRVRRIDTQGTDHPLKHKRKTVSQSVSYITAPPRPALTRPRPAPAPRGSQYADGARRRSPAKRKTAGWCESLRRRPHQSEKCMTHITGS